MNEPVEAYQPDGVEPPPASAAAVRRHVVLLVPGDLEARTGGYGYDRAMVDGLRARGWQVDVCALDGSYPWPSAEARRATAAHMDALPDNTLVLADGLAFGAMPEEAERHASRLRLVALVHHPLALERGLSAGQAASLFASEQRALRCVTGVVVTSAATVSTLHPYGVPSTQVVVVPPGTDAAPEAHGWRGIDAALRPDHSVVLLCVASITPRKGHRLLVQALHDLHGSVPWRLRVAGNELMDLATTRALRDQVASAGLEGQVEFVGDLSSEALSDAYDHADAFVLPTYFEGYGMAVAEAVAHGLPVISTRTGAIPDLVDERSGLLVEPGDGAGLREALRVLIEDDTVRTRLTHGARRRREGLPRWPESVRLMADALERWSHDGIIQR
ncbi:MAG: glycosyltransferase family 4 protein [Acidobacteria bacterium]|nr:glycosyltransferase family 4 protein [Acidobacteriota bacterium]